MKFFVIFTFFTLNACSFTPNLQKNEKEEQKTTEIWVHKCPGNIFNANFQNKSCS